MRNDLEIQLKGISNISEDEIEQLNRITSTCFGKEVPLEETKKQFEESEFLSLLKQNGIIRGYGLNSQMSLNGYSVNYFGSAFIDPNLHDRSIYGDLNLFRAGLLPNSAILTRTQNPKVYSGFRRLCMDKGLVLSPDNEGNIDSNSLELARAFSKNRGGAFFSECDDEQICRNLYGRGLMGSTPIPNVSTREVMGKLDVLKGDAVILVGRNQ